MKKLFSQLIFPKMETEIRDFDPFKSKFPINIWLIHWLDDYREIIAKDGLFELIQSKIIRNLNNFDFLDEKSNFLLDLLRPWRNILEKSGFEFIAKRSIMPKVLFILQGLKIQPNDQNIRGFLVARDWMEFIDREQAEGLLEKHVIGKLKEILMKWLGIKGRKVDEIRVWIEGWRGLMGKGEKVREWFGVMERMIGAEEEKNE